MGVVDLKNDIIQIFKEHGLAGGDFTKVADAIMDKVIPHMTMPKDLVSREDYNELQAEADKWARLYHKYLEKYKELELKVRQMEGQ